MRMDLGFRLSSYLTLGLATLCLGYAELFFLPHITFFVLPVLALLAIAFCAEGRWSMPIWGANLLGLGIAAGAGLWITLCLIRPGPNRLEGIPLPVALLPYLGPLLTILLVAKLFRPKKPNDHWLLQGMGLLQVGLGCVLANDFLFGVLILAYLASGLWFLALFHVQRELTVPEREVPLVALRSPFQAPRLFWPVGRWTLVVGVAGVALFLLIPRFGATQWSLLGQLGGAMPEGWSSQTGLSEMIDLHRVGTVELNDEVALIVHAHEADGSAKLDLSGLTRWRGAVLDRHHDGRWLSSSSYNRQVERALAGAGTPGPPLFEAATLTGLLPELGAQQYTLTYTVDPHVVGGLVLAEPVVVHPGKVDVPAATFSRSRNEVDLLFVKNDWILMLDRHRDRRDRRELSYRQVVLALEEADLSVPVRLSETQLLQLTSYRGSSLRFWTEMLLHSLAAQSTYGLTTEELGYDELGTIRHLRPEHHEKAARALCAYLATSGEYTYTLNLRRHDRRMEPTEDFLRNVRQGHCERYAAALAMMLRSQGVPTRVVKGFRGCESLGDGRYLIRHSDAHSWVEALVPRAQPDGSTETHWLTLDPTPNIEAPEASRFSAAWWWENGQRAGRMAWKEYVLEYDIEQQTTLWIGSRRLVAAGGWRLLDTGGVWLAGGLTLAVLAGVGFWLGRRYWPRRGKAAARGPEGIFYARLLSILSRRCQLSPRAAQTPREFGETARRLLRTSAGGAALADVPARVAALFYRVRFGRLPLSAAEQQELDQQLCQLDTALTRP